MGFLSIQAEALEGLLEGEQDNRITLEKKASVIPRVRKKYLPYIILVYEQVCNYKLKMSVLIWFIFYQRYTTSLESSKRWTETIV